MKFLNSNPAEDFVCHLKAMDRSLYVDVDEGSSLGCRVQGEWEVSLKSFCVIGGRVWVLSRDARFFEKLSRLHAIDPSLNPKP